PSPVRDPLRKNREPSLSNKPNGTTKNLLVISASHPASSRRNIVPFNNDVISAVRAHRALTGKRSPKIEPRAFALVQT
ncbi:MAG: hypothetical protein IK083_07965, partial [Abditibacteriota bacterium]|nr:hypothetical protein [Abditibacteriota bacterium]